MSIPETAPDQMSFWEHLQELRVRLTRILLGVAVAFAVTYYFRFRIWDFVNQPIAAALTRQTGQTVAQAQPFAFHDLTEPFFSLMRLSLWTAALLAAPVVFLQIWAFVRPGLLPKERRFAVPFVLVTSVCFLSGAAFAHYQAFKFLADILFQEALSAHLRPMLSIESALDLYLGTVLMTGLMFELPVLFFFLAKLKLVTAKWMLKYWRHATVAIVIFSAFFTPGDVVATTIFFSVILLALYFVSVAVVWIAQPKAPKEDAS